MKIITVSELGDVVTGHTPPTSKREYYGDYIPFIKPTDISIDSKYTYAPEEYYSQLGYEKYKKSLIPKGATCVVCIGTLGEKMTMSACDCFTNQSINTIIPNENYDNEYVYYLLKYNLDKVKARNRGTASGREFVSKSSFLGMELEVHENISTQKRIGEILSSYDKLIENNQQQINLLEEVAQRLYKEWFVDLRFPGHETTSITDGIPEGWLINEVADFGEIVTGKTPSTSKEEYYGGNIPFVKIPDMHSRVFPVTTEVCLTKEGANTQKNKYIPRNSLMVSCIATVGLVNIALEECQTNQQINSVILYNERDLYFLYFTLKQMKDLLDGVGSNGATMTNVNKTKFGKIPVVCPTGELRTAFFEWCEPVFRKIENLSRNIILLQEARDSLLPKLMNGEIEV